MGAKLERLGAELAKARKPANKSQDLFAGFLNVLN